MKKKPRPRKPRSPKPKSPPSALSRFLAAMEAENDLEAGEPIRAGVIQVIFSKIIEAFPPSSDGYAILGVDISPDDILDAHECVRCSRVAKGIGYMSICHDVICVYPICPRCGKLASVPGPVSEEIERIVCETLGIEQ